MGLFPNSQQTIPTRKNRPSNRLKLLKITLYIHNKTLYNIVISKGKKEDTMSYNYLTKKQANVIYAAYKRGDVTMDKATINRMYGMVGVADEKYGHFDMACDHIINGRLDMAQAELDGKCTAERTRCLREPIDPFELDIDSMTDEEFLAAFDDEGEWETYWVVL